MREISKQLKVGSTLVVNLLFLLIPHLAMAASTSGGMSQVNSFLKSIITALTGVAGLVATAFFVIGGFKYITSSGNPNNLEHAKKTIIYSAIGLAITIASFVLSSIIANLASSAFGG